MESLMQLIKQIKANGHFSREEVMLLREAMLDEEGMTLAKGNILFDLKNTVNLRHVAPEFSELFVDAITSLLLEDEISPGEIDDNEARWLRAKIQYKGEPDRLDKALLSNLHEKSINFPKILNFKTTKTRLFEDLLYKMRYLTFLAVAGSLLAALILFIEGFCMVFEGYKLFPEILKDYIKYEELIEVFVSSVDIFLFAMVLVIFGMGVYELFISKIDPVEQERDKRPSWLKITSIDDLKSSLGKVIVMVLIVLFFKEALKLTYDSTTDLLKLAVGIALVALALAMAHGGHGESPLKKKE